MYIYIHVYIYIHTYIYISPERRRSLACIQRLSVYIGIYRNIPDTHIAWALTVSRVYSAYVGIYLNISEYARYTYRLSADGLSRVLRFDFCELEEANHSRR